MLNKYVGGLAFELWVVLWKYEFLLLQSLQDKENEKIDQLFDEIEFFIRWQESDLQRFVAERILDPGTAIEDPIGDICVWDGRDFIIVKRPRSGKYLKIPHMVICPVCHRARPLSRKQFFFEPFYLSRVKGSIPRLKTPLDWFEKFYLKPCDDGPCKSEYRMILQPNKNPRVCQQCGKSLPEGSSLKRKYCSNTCKTRYNRAKEYVKKLSE